MAVATWVTPRCSRLWTPSASRRSSRTSGSTSRRRTAAIRSRLFAPILPRSYCQRSRTTRSVSAESWRPSSRAEWRVGASRGTRAAVRSTAAGSPRAHAHGSVPNPRRRARAEHRRRSPHRLPVPPRGATAQALPPIRSASGESGSNLPSIGRAGSPRRTRRETAPMGRNPPIGGGEGGIRTPDTLTGMPVFETGASTTLPPLRARSDHVDAARNATGAPHTPSRKAPGQVQSTSARAKNVAQHLAALVGEDARA